MLVRIDTAAYTLPMLSCHFSMEGSLCPMMKSLLLLHLQFQNGLERTQLYFICSSLAAKGTCFSGHDKRSRAKANFVHPNFSITGF